MLSQDDILLVCVLYIYIYTTTSVQYTVPFQMFLKEYFHTNQVCVYLTKNTIKSEIFFQFKITVFYLNKF